MTAHVVIRAEQPRDAGLPGWLYWDGRDGGAWGDYATATRYDHTPDTAALAAPMRDSTIAVVAAYPVDALGFPYLERDGVAWRVTLCCAAAVSAGDPQAGVYCKSCFEAVPAAYDAPVLR